MKRRKGRDDETSLICKLCNSSNKLISNKAFVEESNRIKENARLHDPSCLNSGLVGSKRLGIPEGRRYKNITKKINRKVISLKKLLPTCPNHIKGIISNPELYWLDSKNRKPLDIKDHLPQMSYPDANGNINSIDEFVSQTFKCKECHSKFTVAITPSKSQHYHQINHALFLLLVNKETLSRGMEVFNISMQNIYQRIEFFYKQCVQFDQYQLNKT
jgi:hypothetical protein